MKPTEHEVLAQVIGYVAEGRSHLVSDAWLQGLAVLLAAEFERRGDDPWRPVVVTGVGS